MMNGLNMQELSPTGRFPTLPTAPFPGTPTGAKLIFIDTELDFSAFEARLIVAEAKRRHMKPTKENMAALAVGQCFNHHNHEVPTSYRCITSIETQRGVRYVMFERRSFADGSRIQRDCDPEYAFVLLSGARIADPFPAVACVPAKPV